MTSQTVHLIRKLPTVQPWPPVFCPSFVPIELEVMCTITIDLLRLERHISCTTSWSQTFVGVGSFVALVDPDEPFDSLDETFELLVVLVELSFR